MLKPDFHMDKMSMWGWGLIDDLGHLYVKSPKAFFNLKDAKLDAEKAIQKMRRS